MGYRVIDLATEEHKLSVNQWNWRPTIELIKSFNVISDERLSRLEQQVNGVEVTPEEASAIGQKLREEIMPRLTPDQRILLDLSITTEPDENLMDFDNPFNNYSANREWLDKFSEFCLSSKGFRVV